MNSFDERYVDDSNMPYDTFRSSMYEVAINYNRDLYRGISDLKKRKK